MMVLLSLVPSLPLLPALLTVQDPDTWPTLPHRLPSSLCVSDTFSALPTAPTSMRRAVLGRPGSPRPDPKSIPPQAPRLPTIHNYDDSEVNGAVCLHLRPLQAVIRHLV